MDEYRGNRMDDAAERQTFIEDWREKLCIALAGRGLPIYMYPIETSMVGTGIKVLTRDGRRALNLTLAQNFSGETRITGYVGDAPVMWDAAGRYRGAYADDPLDLYVPERYWDKDWKDKSHLSNAEWQIKYGRDHADNVRVSWAVKDIKRKKHPR